MATNSPRPVSRPAEPDEPAFLEALRRRDPDAFSRLVDKYGARLLGLARQFARDRDEADDLVQEIFIEIYRSLPKYRGDSALYTFLFRIALNRSARARTRARAREARLSLLQPGSDRERHEAASPPALGPAATAERQEANSMAEAALAGLDPSHRAALYLRAVEGLAYPEIAAILGCPTGTVKSRIFFARLRVGEALGVAGEAAPRRSEAVAKGSVRDPDDIAGDSDDQ